MFTIATHLVKIFPVFSFCEYTDKKFMEQTVNQNQKNIYIKHMLGYEDDHSLQENFETCEHFLVKSEIENWKHRVFKFHWIF